MPRYPIYIPSKGRYEVCHTVSWFKKEDIPYFLVVEPQEKDEYGSRWGYDNLLVLPWNGNDEVRQEFCKNRGIENGGLIAVRNWIKERSVSMGDARHWQLDDNICYMMRWYKGKRIHCDANIGFAAAEDFTDRYENIAISGLNYAMFGRGKKPPFHLNCRVYSCSLYQ